MLTAPQQCGSVLKEIHCLCPMLPTIEAVY